MNYEFYFDTHQEATQFICRAQDIAKEYDKVSLADLCDLAGENKYDWWATAVYWVYTTIIFDMHYVYVSDKHTYRITMPIPDETPTCDKVSYNHCECRTTWRNTYKAKKTPTPEPLNITILMDPAKDPYTTIREVIQQANEIKDRPVFITIN